MTLTEQSKDFSFLTLPEVKKHLHINDAYTDDDSYLTTLIEVATRVVEQDSSFNIADSVYQLSDRLDYEKEYEFDLGNIRSIDSFTLDGPAFSDYTLEISDFKALFKFKNRLTGDIAITASAGYLTANTNKILEQCILIKIFGLYDNERSEYNSINYYKNDVYNNLINFYRKNHFL